VQQPGLVLEEIAAETDLETVLQLTEAPLIVGEPVKRF
jgi:acyl CoA:acetate/3-ketoacid CoA transferase beta subunit